MDIIKWLGIAGRYRKMYLDKHLAPLGLNSSQYMYVIRACQEPGLTQDRFVESFHIHPSNVTRAVAALEKGGFLRREACREDKRTSYIYPTEKALSCCGRIFAACGEAEEAMTAGFTQEERKELGRLLKRAGENLAARGMAEGPREHGPETAEDFNIRKYERRNEHDRRSKRKQEPSGV